MQQSIEPINKCQLVRETSQWIVSQANSVTINQEHISKVAGKFSYKPFNEDAYHETPSDPESALFQLFMLDCLNFCFWPLEGFEYAELAEHVQRAIKEGITLGELATLTQEGLEQKIFHGVKVPLAESRTHILKELACIMTSLFESSFVKLVERAQKSVVRLLSILTSSFPNFQDHSIFKGRQVHFYKRAQILIGDIYGKFGGKGLGQFKDVNQLTMFPDYRVPQVLWKEGVLEYSQDLSECVREKKIIERSAWQIQLRGASVVAVEMLKEELKKRGREVLSIEVDWFLWQLGEGSLNSLPPHHRCLTIYY